MPPRTPHTPNEKGVWFAKSRAERVGIPPLAAEQWDFRRVPEVETLACCLYEHAREFVLASPELQRRLATVARVTSAPKGTKTTPLRWTAESAVWELLRTPLGSPYSRPDMASVSWSRLSNDERAAGVAIVTRSETPSQFSLQPGDEIPGTEIPGICPPIIHNPPKRGGIGVDFKTVMRGGQTIFLSPDFAEFVAFHTQLSRMMDLPTEAVEFGFFAVDWNYTNEQLRNALLDWLDREIEMRPNRKPAHSRQGKDKEITPLGWLNALGATRLLRSGLTLQAARDYSEATSRHRTALFQDIADWSRARRRTFPGVMRKLFGNQAVWVK